MLTFQICIYYISTFNPLQRRWMRFCIWHTQYENITFELLLKPAQNIFKFLYFNMSHTVEYLIIYVVNGQFHRFLATHSMFVPPLYNEFWLVHSWYALEQISILLSVKYAFVISSRARLCLRRPVFELERNTRVQAISPLTARNRRQMIRSWPLHVM